MCCCSRDHVIYQHHHFLSRHHLFLLLLFLFALPLKVMMGVCQLNYINVFVFTVLTFTHTHICVKILTLIYLDSQSLYDKHFPLVWHNYTKSNTLNYYAIITLNVSYNFVQKIKMCSIRNYVFLYIRVLLMGCQYNRLSYTNRSSAYFLQ